MSKILAIMIEVDLTYIIPNPASSVKLIIDLLTWEV